MDAQELLQTQLSRYRDTTLAGLLAAVPDREPREYLYGPVSAHLGRIGKSIRPALCLATCRAFGGDADRRHDVGEVADVAVLGAARQDFVADDQHAAVTISAIGGSEIGMQSNNPVRQRGNGCRSVNDLCSIMRFFSYERLTCNLR